MQACGVEPFWSCSTSQAAAWGLTDRAIIDEVPGHGPASGLHAAFTRGEQVAWLVVGCDYPFLEAQDLQRLIDARTEHVQAVAFTNDATKKIEPMISLWEPAAQQAFVRAFRFGEYSAYRVLRTSALRLLKPRAPEVLENRNAPGVPRPMAE